VGVGAHPSWPVHGAASTQPLEPLFSLGLVFCPQAVALIKMCASPFPHEVCEMALAHTIRNGAETAYTRGDLLEKRRKLIDALADFISIPYDSAQVILLRSAA